MSLFATLTTDSKSASNSAIFYTYLAFLKNTLFIILALFATLKSNAGETAQKNGKHIL
jgi:hypothetical protein